MATLEGIVYHKTDYNAEPFTLSNAHVQLYPGLEGTSGQIQNVLSDTNGKFVFSNVPSGTLHVRVMYAPGAGTPTNKMIEMNGTVEGGLSADHPVAIGSNTFAVRKNW